jgi:hypothetical protein
VHVPGFTTSTIYCISVGVDCKLKNSNYGKGMEQLRLLTQNLKSYFCVKAVWITFFGNVYNTEEQRKNMVCTKDKQT